MSTTYLSIHDVARRYSISRRSVWRWTSRGLLPQPHRLSEQCVRWRLDELERHDAERDAQQAA
jgi:prophage regulatory protein